MSQDTTNFQLIKDFLSEDDTSRKEWVHFYPSTFSIIGGIRVHQGISLNSAVHHSAVRSTELCKV